jgi:hypothetical protein
MAEKKRKKKMEHHRSRDSEQTVDPSSLDLWLVTFHNHENKGPFFVECLSCLKREYVLHGKVAKWKERTFREEGIEDFNVRCKCT